MKVKIILVEKTSKLLEKLGKKILKISIKKKSESLKFIMEKYSLKEVGETLFSDL